MRFHLVVILVLLALCQGGCALPRTLWLSSRVPKELPVIVEGQRLSLTVDPTAVSPGGGSTILSPLPVDETRDWYNAALLQKGWKFYTTHTDMDGNKGIDYKREIGFHVGKEFVRTGSESLSLDVIPQANSNRCRVKLYVYGNYTWDWPSQLPFGISLWTLGETDACEFVWSKLLFWL